jgi:hypothetical protein
MAELCEILRPCFQWSKRCRGPVYYSNISQMLIQILISGVCFEQYPLSDGISSVQGELLLDGAGSTHGCKWRNGWTRDTNSLCVSWGDMSICVLATSMEIAKWTRLLDGIKFEAPRHRQASLKPIPAIEIRNSHTTGDNPHV